MKNFILYSTSHCHLCELAEQMLIATLNGSLHSVEVEDIAHDDLLITQYGLKIPVLRDLHSKEELEWPFDIEMVSKFIE